MKDDNQPCTDPKQFQQKKRCGIFFASDVGSCVDYIEGIANSFAQPDDFKRAVVNKLAATYVFGVEDK